MRPDDRHVFRWFFDPCLAADEPQAASRFHRTVRSPACAAYPAGAAPVTPAPRSAILRGMRIATWNVNGLRARMDFIARWLESREPDVVGLQELKMRDEDFPRDAFRALGYHAVVHGQKSWNGVAVLSRAPAEADARGLPGRGDDGARLLRVRVAGLDFATVYCPNGKTLDHPDFAMKLAWFDALRDYLAGADRDAAFVIGGDFNIVPAPLDCWQGEAADGSIFCTAEERSRYRALLDLGLTDLFRHRQPEERQFSWWDYRGGSFHRGMGLRIDMLLGAPAVVSRVRRVEIDREYRKKQDGLTASDHAPVFADLD